MSNHDTDFQGDVLTALRESVLAKIPDAAEFWIVEDGTAAPRCPHCGGNLDGPGAAAGGAA